MNLNRIETRLAALKQQIAKQEAYRLSVVFSLPDSEIEAELAAWREQRGLPPKDHWPPEWGER